jgi:hypothetical protein
MINADTVTKLITSLSEANPTNAALIIVFTALIGCYRGAGDSLETSSVIILITKIKNRIREEYSLILETIAL